MGNTIKLVSGFILFVIGVLIAYETAVYNLIDILLIVGLIISIVGIILMVSYFVESNADKTTNKIKEFLVSGEAGRHSFSFEKDSKGTNSNGPLKVRKEFNDYDDSAYEEMEVGDYPSSDGSYFNDDYDRSSKAVLNVVPQKETEVNFDNQLDFKPYYGKPLKVTRAPKRRQGEYFSDEIPEFVVEPTNNSNEIQNALAVEEPVIEPIHDHVLEPVYDPPTRRAPEVPAREIKIDVNNPESLPVPKSLNSFVLSDEGLLTSQEAFDNLAVNVNKEIMLEIPSLNDLSDRFLSHVPTIYSRVIINEFDVSDMSYMFLISSLIKQGVHIKTVPKVHSINLITDDSYAMIISEGKGDMEYGAIYNDRNSISNIRADFEKTWNIASNLDENALVSVANGGVT
ncbi:hypothetical protein [Methanobrevibacter sp.]|uniref:hypothetical protein n=1 Tax=Methanobrevibacter sp. TaxID=66852 RepID=UPI002E76DAA0|nr:hypothetical protein [Methanobrevibacter sp.]MEE1336205.1 hypothetical protein [Methanobrevibacter sp.]